MPITQTRMIALINAANDYRQAFTTLISHITSQRQNIDASLTTPAYAFEYIEAVAQPHLLLSTPEQSATTIAIEHYHFSHSLRRNQRAAEKASTRRRLLSTPPRQHHPVPFETSNLYGFSPSKPSSLSRPIPPSTTVASTIEAEAQATADNINARVAAGLECPHCRATSLDDCPSLSTCQWTSRILSQQQSEADQDDFCPPTNHARENLK